MGPVGQRRDRGPADRRRDQLSPDLHRLPDRRRQLLRLEGQLRSADVADRGIGADDRLRPDRGGLGRVVDRAGHVGRPGAVRRPGHPRRPRHPPDHDRQPARPARGRQPVRDPDLRVPRVGAPDDRDRFDPDRRLRRAGRVLRRARSTRPARASRPVGDPPASGVRGGCRGPHRNGGDRDRCAGIRAARGEERRHDARRHGRTARRPVHRPHVPGGQLRDHPPRGAGEADGDQPDRGQGLRRGLDPILPVPGVHRAPPRPGREHELQRVPAAACDPRARRVRAPPVLVPRRPPRVQLRDHRPGRGRRVPHLALPGRDPPPDPAVRRRRVHRLHDQPVRHDPALAARATAGLATATRDQRLRRNADRGRCRRRHRREGTPVA